jgi:hypothetical protein
LSAGTIRQIPKGLVVLKKNLDFGAESSILIGVDRNSIYSPIEQRRYRGKGVPWAVERRDFPLNNRQQALLNKLPEFDSRATVGKSDVSMTDLAALTAKTGDEFAMFTRKQERLIIRGDREHVAIELHHAAEMRVQGYIWSIWSGHTHAEVGDLVASDGDRAVLAAFEQDGSVIYDPDGKYRRFFR